MILGDVRDKLYNTRERTRQLLASGTSDIPEDTTFTHTEQVISNWIKHCIWCTYLMNSVLEVASLFVQTFDT